MTSTQNREVVLFVSSDDNLGAVNVNAGRSRFTTFFNKPLIFPNAQVSRNYTIELYSGTIWWVSANVSTAKSNNTMNIEINGSAISSPIVFPNGLYDISALNSAMSSQFINQGLSGSLVSFSGDNATQKVQLNIEGAVAPDDVQVIWSAGSPWELLGFVENQTVPLAPATAPYSQLAPLTATFSEISSFLYNTSLTAGQGIPIGNRGSSALGQGLINVSPGSQINTQPFTPLRIPANHLAGSTIASSNFWLTSQTGEEGDLDFGDENFTMIINIKYHQD